MLPPKRGEVSEEHRERTPVGRGEVMSNRPARRPGVV